jgi:transcriptional regulator
MYQTNHFSSGSYADLLAFMEDHSFATICGIGMDGFPVATHVPLLVEQRHDTVYLKGHIMRKQLHTLAFADHNKVLAIFNGPHTYISAKMYEPQNTASTWNYSTVHATGEIQFLNDQDLYHLLEKLTAKYEKDPASPAQFQQMSEAYIQSNMKAIVAFEIKVTDLKHVFKWSQNKSVDIQDKIIQNLFNGTLEDQLAAKEMILRLNKP